MTEEGIYQALRDCYHPEIPLNVVDLGRVERVKVQLDPDAPGAGIAGVPERYSAAVTLLPDGGEQGGAQEAQLRATIHNRLAGMPELSRIVVVVGEGEAWTPARINAAGRRRLGLSGPEFPILNNRVRSL